VAAVVEIARDSTTAWPVAAPIRGRAWLLGAGVSCAIALAAWAVFDAYLDLDAMYALVRGQQLAQGSLPEYGTPYSPTPHPLTLLTGALASVFGREAGYDLLVGLAYVSFGALVWSVFRFGQTAFSWPVGLLAAVVIATSLSVLSRSLLGFVDIPFLALIVFAAALEARSPRRGVPVLVLLGLAGLLRPEAWILAAAYWAYLAPGLDPRGRVRMAAAAAAGPVLWALSDLIVTGDPLFSLHTTQEAVERTAGVGDAQDGGGSTHSDDAAKLLVDGLRTILRLPVLLGAGVGLALGLVACRARAALPAAVLALGGVNYLILMVADVRFAERYLFLPAAMLAVFFALGAAGFGHARDAGQRRAWGILGAVLLAGLAASAPAQVDRLGDLRDRVALSAAIVDDLQELARDPAAAGFLRRCEPLYVAHWRVTPFVSYLADRSPSDISSLQFHRPDQGAVIEPATRRVIDNLLSNPGPRLLDPEARRRFERVSANQSWTLYQRGC
jgi:hypothetical protein